MHFLDCGKLIKKQVVGNFLKCWFKTCFLQGTGWVWNCLWAYSENNAMKMTASSEQNCFKFSHNCLTHARPELSIFVAESSIVIFNGYGCYVTAGPQSAEICGGAKKIVTVFQYFWKFRWGTIAQLSLTGCGPASQFTLELGVEHAKWSATWPCETPMAFLLCKMQSGVVLTGSLKRLILPVPINNHILQNIVPGQLTLISADLRSAGNLSEERSLTRGPIPCDDSCFHITFSFWDIFAWLIH